MNAEFNLILGLNPGLIRCWREASGLVPVSQPQPKSSASEVAPPKGHGPVLWFGSFLAGGCRIWPIIKIKMKCIAKLWMAAFNHLYYPFICGLFLFYQLFGRKKSKEIVKNGNFQPEATSSMTRCRWWLSSAFDPLIIFPIERFIVCLKMSEHLFLNCWSVFPKAHWDIWFTVRVEKQKRLWSWNLRGEKAINQSSNVSEINFLSFDKLINCLIFAAPPIWCTLISMDTKTLLISNWAYPTAKQNLVLYHTHRHKFNIHFQISNSRQQRLI